MIRSSFLILALVWAVSPVVFAQQSQGEPFVIVELFSSEGCSSCPLADLLVSKLSAWARQNNEPVYPLIFHVDYWNNLGWKDVFSRGEFTQRQSNYAQVLKDQGVYTPEMIVNGSDAFVGSDQRQLQNDIDHDLLMAVPVVLHLKLIKEDGQVIVQYSSEGFSNGDVVNIALVERGLYTQVTAGENAGRKLRHDNVVREFKTIPLTNGPSQAVVSLNRISDISNASVIVYVQDPQTMRIKAAKQLDLGND